MSDEVSRHLLQLTATIVAAHVSRNHVAANALPSLVESVYRSFASAGEGAAAPAAQVPAVPVSLSVFTDYLICLEDGNKLKMLKQHLLTRHGMTPEQYRAKWSLPADYPMAAPASARSASARKSGLGHETAADRVAALPPKRRRKGLKRKPPAL